MPIRFLFLAKFFLYLAPFAVVVVTNSTLFPFIVGKYTFFKVAVELALACAVLAWGLEGRSFERNYKILKSPIVGMVSLFVLIFLFSGLLGINQHASFWSSFERGEGSFLMLHFYAYFVLLLLFFEKKDDWRKLFIVSIVSAVLVIGYGLLAAMGVVGYIGTGLCKRFGGSLGNPAYVGTFSIFILFYVAYFAATGDWLRASWRRHVLPLLLVLAAFFSVFLLLSQTRGAILGIAAGVVAGLAYLFFTIEERKVRIAIGVLALLLVGLGFLGVYFRQSIDLMPFCRGIGESGNRIFDISLNVESYQTRLILWSQSITAFKDKPLLGWGPENFSTAFEKYFDIRHKVWFDRAHNIFFDYLVFSGIAGLLSFLGIFAAFFWQFFHKFKKHLEELGQNKKNLPRTFAETYQPRFEQALIFALPIAYLVQGSVLFDVLPIYIHLFIFLAFANWRFRNSELQIAKSK